MFSNPKNNSLQSAKNPPKNRQLRRLTYSQILVEYPPVLPLSIAKTTFVKPETTQNAKVLMASSRVPSPRDKALKVCAVGQSLNADRHTSPLKISWENLFNNQSIFPQLISLSMLSTFSVD